MGFKLKPGEKPARMHPRYGGQPLPLSPIVLPKLEGAMRMQTIAAEYVKTLDKELNTAADGVMKWDGAQLAYIRRLRAKWLTRSLGQDPHYAKHGTFRRPPTADPPGMSELWQEQTRRKEEARTGVRVNSAARQRKFKNPTIHDIVKGWKKKWGTKDTKPEED